MRRELSIFAVGSWCNQTASGLLSFFPLDPLPSHGNNTNTNKDTIQIKIKTQIQMKIQTPSGVLSDFPLKPASFIWQKNKYKEKYKCTIIQLQIQIPWQIKQLLGRACFPLNNTSKDNYKNIEYKNGHKYRYKYIYIQIKQLRCSAFSLWTRLASRGNKKT